MSLGISLGTSLRLTQRISHSLRLTIGQRVAVQSESLAIRLALIQAIRDERYEPRGNCPKCDRRLTPIEVINGFNRDPNDFTTCCTKCGHRFEPILVCFMDGGHMEIPFYCDSQTLAQLEGKETLPPEQFSIKFPGIYRSAIVHHGGVAQAFAKIGINYPFEEISDLKHKVAGFLGRLPDTIIAACAGVAVHIIRSMRRKAGIDRYTIAKTLEEVEEKS